MKMSKSRFPILTVVMALSIGLLLSSITMSLHSNQQQAVAQKQIQRSSSSSSSSSSLPNVVTVQNTSMSVPAPSALANKQNVPHQIVVALPLRDDGKIWTGTVTFTASKPIEIEVEHKYNPKVIPDTRHGAPYHGIWIDNTTPIALSTMTMFSNTPVTVTNTPISTGSLVFAGSALVFHKTDGVPFTVTYTIDAVAKSLTQK
ncbi:MAG: hypothetical protein JO297_21750 [Nitrososphaeraceae archaeon]|nr:hypothetical protein [Nitrososphaeraceae archaeon]